jgi:type IV pilus assembly protein PilE
MRRSRGLRNRRRAAGFTLIEVIIVVVIVGILMAVALPGYQDSLRKGRRADAKAALMDAANRQERFMLDRSTYTADMRNLGFAADPMVSEEGHYTIDVDPNDPACPINTCYVLTATPIAGGAQEDDTYCTSFSVTSGGAKNATGSLGSECW